MNSLPIMPALPANPTVFEACSFVQSMVQWIGPGYHPDTDFNDYVDDTDKRVFSAKLARILNAESQRAFDVLSARDIDPCSVAIKIQRRLIKQLMA